MRANLKGGGPGQRVMHKLIECLRAWGTQRLVATVLRENKRMLELAHELGFVHGARQPQDGTGAIQLALR